MSIIGLLVIISPRAKLAICLIISILPRRIHRIEQVGDLLRGELIGVYIAL